MFFFRQHPNLRCLQNSNGTNSSATNREHACVTALSLTSEGSSQVFFERKEDKETWAHTPVQMEGCNLCVVSVIPSVWLPFYHIVSAVSAKGKGSRYRHDYINSSRGRIHLSVSPVCSTHSFSVNPENWVLTQIAGRWRDKLRWKPEYFYLCNHLWIKHRWH